MRRIATVLLVLGMSACSGDSSSPTGTDDDKDGGRSIEAKVRTDPPGVIDARDTECRFDGERQYTARGVVENAGDSAHHVTIAVRFIDAEGVRVDLAGDSVSNLEPGEAARWAASIYNDDADDVTTCEVSTTAS